MLADEIGYGFVAGFHFGGAQEFHAHADFGGGAEESGGQQGQDLGGDHHHQAVGQGHEFAAFAHVGDAQVVVGPDDIVAQTEFADEVHGGRFHGEETIRPGLDGAAFDLFGLDHAAEARARFDDGGGGAPLGQVVGCGESGDAAADDDYARGQHRFATFARAAVNVGEPFKLSGRDTAMPRSAA